MTKRQDPIDVYLETGAKRTFAGAIDWPGWCRSGKDPVSALQSLFEYGPRYARAIEKGRIEFTLPSSPDAFQVIEQLAGGSGTDFGAPEAVPTADTQPVSDAELDRLLALLSACWQAFDDTAQSAVGKQLRTGPRGGGRQIEKIFWHTLGAEAAYLSRLGGKVAVDETADPIAEYARVRRAVLDTLPRAVRGELPAQGPRGGTRWTPRYFIRRSAWHVLDHAWEIEDRLIV
jgi:hypothetical protein